ncbi:MAG: ABC transporter substrate-binding protein [Nocardioidaceae bacterium]
MTLIARVRATAASTATAVLLTACGGGAASQAADPVDAARWETVLSQARGQSVRWYMYGGDSTLNSFVNGYVADRLAEQGVTLKQVRVQDTADAVNKVLGEVQAGRTSGGGVDAVWVNGENFATGVQAGLWSCGWAQDLPSAAYVDATDPAISHDFGVPVEGCEAPWQQASSALVYDSARLSARDVRSLATLQDWVERHPGRFTYPAPPDFTGSMVVRTFLHDTPGSGALPDRPSESTYPPVAARLWSRLQALEPSLWRRGETYPQTQAEVERLYADGAVAAYFTYGPGAVGDLVAKGVFPATTRQAVLAGGNVGNVSFVAIPSNAEHRAAALVLADVLGEPRTQLELYRAEGVFPAVDLDTLGPALRAEFAAVPTHPSVLPLAELTRNVVPELSSSYVERLERDWTTRVLQR